MEGDGTFPGGSVAARDLLSRFWPPTAIFCFNDVSAIGVLGVLQQAGVRVPEQMSVVGFDDIEFAMHSYPPLTTVRQPAGLMGQRLIYMLLQLIAGQKDVAAEVLPAELVIRESTSPPRTLA